MTIDEEKLRRTIEECPTVKLTEYQARQFAQFLTIQQGRFLTKEGDNNVRQE